MDYTRGTPVDAVINAYMGKVATSAYYMTSQLYRQSVHGGPFLSSRQFHSCFISRLLPAKYIL